MKKVNLLIALICLMACNHPKPDKTGLEGKPLPTFSILLPDSTTYFNTSRIPSGKPVVLFYFSPFCPYCKAQMRDIITEMSDMKDLQFYLVTRFPISDMKRFSNDYQLGNYPNIIIGKDTADFIPDYFKISGVPYTAIYSKDKKLNKSFLGKIRSSQIKEIAEE